MTTQQRPNDRDDANRPRQTDDACTSAPQAGVGTPVGGDQAEGNDPSLAHGTTIRREIDGSEDGDDAADMVYDDRTDDRPTP